jgi:hypothetical protein
VQERRRERSLRVEHFAAATRAGDEAGVAENGEMFRDRCGGQVHSLGETAGRAGDEGLGEDERASGAGSFSTSSVDIVSCSGDTANRHRAASPDPNLNTSVTPTTMTRPDSVQTESTMSGWR